MSNYQFSLLSKKNILEINIIPHLIYSSGTSGFYLVKNPILILDEDFGWRNSSMRTHAHTHAHTCAHARTHAV